YVLSVSGAITSRIGGDGDGHSASAHPDVPAVARAGLSPVTRASRIWASGPEPIVQVVLTRPPAFVTAVGLGTVPAPLVTTKRTSTPGDGRWSWLNTAKVIGFGNGAPGIPNCASPATTAMSPRSDLGPAAS